MPLWKSSPSGITQTSKYLKKKKKKLNFVSLFFLTTNLHCKTGTCKIKRIYLNSIYLLSLVDEVTPNQFIQHGQESQEEEYPISQNVITSIIKGVKSHTISFIE